MFEQDELKLQAIGRMEAGVRPADLVTELGVSYPTLIKWRKEYRMAKEHNDVTSVLNVDRIALHEVAERVKQDIAELAPAETELISGEVDAAVAGVEGLQLLNARVQTAGLKLAQRVTDMTDEADNARDVCLLVDALAKLQTAFFVRNNTTVNVLNQTTSGISEFKSLMRD